MIYAQGLLASSSMLTRSRACVLSLACYSICMAAKKQLVKSKARVKAHGEVFTPDFLVEQMLDGFPKSCWLIEKNFLEPTCGNGQFIIGILRRKIAANLTCHKPQESLLSALDTTFGMDIMRDNVSECRIRIYNEIVIPHWRRFSVYGKKRLNQRWQVAAIVMNNIRHTEDSLKEDYTKLQSIGCFTEDIRNAYLYYIREMLVRYDGGEQLQQLKDNVNINAELSAISQ